MSLYSYHVRVKDSSLFWREFTKLFDSFKILKLTHAYIIGCKKSVDFRPYLVSQGEAAHQCCDSTLLSEKQGFWMCFGDPFLRIKSFYLFRLYGEQRGGLEGIQETEREIETE